jgi:hypothetical protein
MQYPILAIVRYLKAFIIFVISFTCLTYLILSMPPFNKIVYPEPIVFLALAVTLVISGLLAVIFYRKIGQHGTVQKNT